MIKHDDIVEIPERLFRESRITGFVSLFPLKTHLSGLYNVILNHRNTIHLHSELEVVGKYNQYNA